MAGLLSKDGNLVNFGTNIVPASSQCINHCCEEAEPPDVADCEPAPNGWVTDGSCPDMVTLNFSHLAFDCNVSCVDEAECYLFELEYYNQEDLGICSPRDADIHVCPFNDNNTTGLYRCTPSTNPDYLIIAVVAVFRCLESDCQDSCSEGRGAYAEWRQVVPHPGDLLLYCPPSTGWTFYQSEGISGGDVTIT